MQASESGVESQLRAFESSNFRTKNVTGASIISFSFTVGFPDIRGLIFGGTMWLATVEKWQTQSLAGITISNLQLEKIEDRFKDQHIISFLADSELPAAGKSSMQGRRRLDTMAASGEPRAADARQRGPRGERLPLLACLSRTAPLHRRRRPAHRR
jgi:hypothetical protein